MNAVWGRSYFALQAIAGAAWWVGVFTLPLVREATLGELDPQLVALFDLPLFVAASGLAALGVRWAAVLATVWTVLVALALTGYATITGLAGWGVLVGAALRPALKPRSCERAVETALSLRRSGCVAHLHWG
ncbi:hypothetical protein M3147_17140 [Agromyces mediolanus]|uniref:hypothetical protein n=1 Tax=Agromyces mediolanus TaxID=41986 RepID=UPI00203FFE09|nr:hypothetical protein [Agromyces mediolanus]MCM3658985.1 hypothetical protein [Agromyces mediolanus]